MSAPSKRIIQPEDLDGKAGYNVVVNDQEDGYTTSSPGEGSTPSYIPATLNSYPTNAAAVAVEGVGVLYKSETLMDGSPIILITI